MVDNHVLEECAASFIRVTKIMPTVHLGLTVGSWRQLGTYVNVLLEYTQLCVIRCDHN